MIDVVECKGCYRRMNFIDLRCDEILDRYSCPHCGHGNFRILPTTTAEWNKIKDRAEFLALNCNYELGKYYTDRNQEKMEEWIQEYIVMVCKHENVFTKEFKKLKEFASEQGINFDGQSS